MNGIEDFSIQHTPNTNRLAIVLLPESIQKPIHGLGFWLKPFESLAINPT